MLLERSLLKTGRIHKSLGLEERLSRASFIHQRFACLQKQPSCASRGRGRTCKLGSFVPGWGQHRVSSGCTATGDKQRDGWCLMENGVSGCCSLLKSYFGCECSGERCGGLCIKLRVGISECFFFPGFCQKEKRKFHLPKPPLPTSAGHLKKVN